MCLFYLNDFYFTFASFPVTQFIKKKLQLDLRTASHYNSTPVYTFYFIIKLNMQLQFRCCVKRL